MIASPSKISRIESLDAKTAQIDTLISSIVPMLSDLGEKDLREVKADLEAKIRSAKKELEKESTKVYLRGTKLLPEK